MATSDPIEANQVDPVLSEMQRQENLSAQLLLSKSHKTFCGHRQLYDT